MNTVGAGRRLSVLASPEQSVLNRLVGRSKNCRSGFGCPCLPADVTRNKACASTDAVRDDTLGPRWGARHVESKPDRTSGRQRYKRSEKANAERPIKFATLAE